ncbi:hypothetical protein HanPI659440_Chr03g0128391 [Helianthus annuus]|nr:hypothetical protein HanPI659440_Chr03g0128391 [Helianthus annuus]
MCVCSGSFQSSPREPNPNSTIFIKLKGESKLKFTTERELVITFPTFGQSDASTKGSRVKGTQGSEREYGRK